MKQSFLRSPRDCLVVGAAIVIGFFVSGTSRLSGLLFVACLERYHVGREIASVPFIVCFVIRNLTSPITGYLGAKFGARLIVLAGCILASTGVGVCFFTEDFMVVIFSWGGIYGLGFGLGCALVPQILSEYFPQHFDKATGLYLGGVSISGVVLPVLEDYAIKKYGVSGSFLILSSALLHTIPAAMILATVTTNLRTSIKEEVQSKKVSKRIPEKSTEIADDKFTSTRVPYDKDSPNLKINLEKYRPSIKEDGENSVCYRIPERTIEIADDEFISNNVPGDNGSPHLEIPLENHEEIENYALFLEKQVLQSKMNVNGQTSPSTLPEGRKRALESFGLFLDPTYILMLLTQGTMSYVIVIIWTVIVDAARDHGVEKHNELHVLEVLYLFEFLGRILLGHITGSGYISKTNCSCLCYVCLGVLLPIFTCLEGFVLVMVAVSFYGLLTGFLTVVGLGIVQQYVEKKYSSMGFAAIYSVYGLMAFSQPPLIGYFRENLHSYDGLFYLMAAMCFICSILTLLIPSVSMCKDRKNRTTEEVF